MRSALKTLPNYRILIMKVNSISTAIKVGNFVLNTGTSKARLKVEWDQSVSKNTLTDNAGRVYILSVDGVVKKIGGSVSKGGIKSTMSFYSSANTGRPSIRSFGINQLIWECLVEGKEVEIHMITSQSVQAPVKGLFGVKPMSISAFKEMEEKCISDYRNTENEFPVWNYQEAGKAWEQYIQEEHALILTKTAKKN